MMNLFLYRYTVHIPSIARARIIPTSILRRPMIYIDCHNGHEKAIIYPFGAWDTAKKDFEALDFEMYRCQKALSVLSATKYPPLVKPNDETDID
jgi:hypothetical protein